MAGCSSCGGRRQNVRYEATFNNGSKQTYETLAEAQSALKSAGGGSFKAVKA